MFGVRNLWYANHYKGNLAGCPSTRLTFLFTEEGVVDRPEDVYYFKGVQCLRTPGYNLLS